MKWNIQGQYEYHLTAQIMLAKTLTVKVYAAQSSKYKILSTALFMYYAAPLRHFV